MAYRDDLKAFAKERREKRKLLFFISKITVVVFACVVFVTTAFAIVDIAVGDNSLVDISSGGSSDRKAPVISLANGGDTIYIYVGETVSWKNAIKVSDSSSYQVEVDNSKVNLSKTGTYTVTYTVTDTYGNSSKLEAKVVVTKAEFSYDKLMTEVGKKAATLGITKSMSKKEQVRAIYDFVNSPDKTSASEANIYFSNKSNSSREDWKADWIEEAILTLDRLEGDCYSYYAVSKAFFEYFGIENMGIQRSESSSESGTHFWSLVNIGDSKAPQWYFYDGTRLAGKFSDGTNDGCLRTLDELNNYRTSKGGKEFYTYDESEYPTPATVKIPR